MEKNYNQLMFEANLAREERIRTGRPIINSTHVLVGEGKNKRYHPETKRLINRRKKSGKS